MMHENDQLTLVFTPKDESNTEEDDVLKKTSKVLSQYDYVDSIGDDKFLKPFHDIYGALCSDLPDGKANWVGIQPGTTTAVRKEITSILDEIEPDYLVIAYEDEPSGLQRLVFL